MANYICPLFRHLVDKTHVSVFRSPPNPHPPITTHHPHLHSNSRFQSFIFCKGDDEFDVHYNSLKITNSKKWDSVEIEIKHQDSITDYFGVGNLG